MIFKKALTQVDFFSLMQIRSIIFMCEQHVNPLLEIDDDDKHCDHFIVEDNGIDIGTCRVLKRDNIWHIGRVAVLKEHRHKHVGSFMLEQVEEIALMNNVTALHLGAQIQAGSFYEKNGYTAFGEHYLDAEIEHVMMEKVL